MITLCLTGWQQPANALKNIAPDAVHFDYDAYADLASCYKALAEFSDVETIIGWSLGGCLTIPAVVLGILKPKKLVLLSAQYQGISGGVFPHGMSGAFMEETKQFYFTDPHAMLQQFQMLMVRGDTYEKQLMRPMVGKPVKLWPNGFFWLEQLERFSAADIDCSDFPPTLIIHGDKDLIAPIEHAEYLHSAIRGSELQIWEGCAHAPHLHEPRKLEEIIGKWSE